MRFFASLLYCFVLLPVAHVLSQSSLRKEAHNPILFADVPDVSIVRVKNDYYMSSTTMHMSPGLPIMKSSDLVNWSLVSYAYDTLVDNRAMNLQDGLNAYGRGSWASCLRYHKGRFYVSTFSQTSGRTHIYSTTNIEKGPWKKLSFKPSYHDHTIFFDDDGRVYLIYGAGKLKLIELNADLSGVKAGSSEKVIIENASAPAGADIMLQAEGSQLFKVKGKYYLFNIVWPKAGMRTVVIHRADKITGPYVGRLGLQDIGVAQGGLIDTPDGTWYAYLFRDYGSVGRIPYLVPVEWKDGWPILGIDGKVPQALKLPGNKSLIPGIVDSDEFDRKNGESILPLVWQWNHNPDNAHWSLNAREGYLRLTTSRVDTAVVQAKNILTQRTIGPQSTGSTFLDVTSLKDGDVAGIVLLQKEYGFIGVKLDGDSKSIVVINNDSIPKEVARVKLNQNSVFLRAECDFTDKKDIARFSYSLDGQSWTVIGTPFTMRYTLPHFMGYRVGLFTYATKNIGGFADFDFFHISETISKRIN